MIYDIIHFIHPYEERISIMKRIFEKLAQVGSVVDQLSRLVVEQFLIPNLEEGMKWATAKTLGKSVDQSQLGSWSKALSQALPSLGENCSDT